MLLGAALGAGALFLVFGTSAPSYVRTAFHKVRQNVKSAVPPQFEIDRARQAIEDLKPMFDQNKETLARAEIEVEKPREGSRPRFRPTWIEHRRRSCLCVIRSRPVKSVWPATSKAPESRPRPSWPIAWTISGTRPDLLKQKTEVLGGQAEDNPGGPRAARDAAGAEVDAAGQAGQHRSQAADDRGDPVQERFQFTTAALSRAKKTVSDLEERLDVMARRAEIEGRMATWTAPRHMWIPHRDIVKEVDEQFGPSESRPAAKAGDKSL